MVAVGAVDLASKLPWSKRYKDHSSMRVGLMDIMQATGAPVYSSMFREGQGEDETKSNLPPNNDQPVSPSGAPAMIPNRPKTSPGTTGTAATTTTTTTTTVAASRFGQPANGAGVGDGGAAGGVGLSAPGGNGQVGGGSGGGLGASWDTTPSVEVRSTNPMYGRGGAAIAQAPLPPPPPVVGAGGGARGAAGTVAGGTAAGSAGGAGAGGAVGVVGAPAPVSVPETEILEIMGQEDEGAGVFGAILHEPGVPVWPADYTCRELFLCTADSIDVPGIYYHILLCGTKKRGRNGWCCCRLWERGRRGKGRGGVGYSW